MTVPVTGLVTVGGAAYPCQAQVTLPGALPPGVTLRPPDGGPAYYASHGLTYAAAAGWDDPSFFPIGADYAFYPGNSPAVFKDLGLNFTHRVTAGADFAALRAAGIWALPSPGDGTGNYGPETIGWHIEEPATWAEITSQVTGLGALAAGRALQISGTANYFMDWVPQGAPGGTAASMMAAPIPTPAGPRHLNLPGCDIYWFAGSTTGTANRYGTAYMGALCYGLENPGDLTRNLTPDLMARGCRYGDMTGWIRRWAAADPAPAAPYIETEDGLAGAGARRITPPELNWAVWSSLIHGARMVLYFGTTSNFGSGSTFGFSRAVLPGQAISMYDQAKATNTLVTRLAPVLNAPTADGYVTVAPPPVTLSPAGPDSGIDTLAKYAAGRFTVFASTRESASRAGTAAVFTTAGGYTGPVAVVGENRTVTAAAGVFADTFAHASDVHIYQPG